MSGQLHGKVERPLTFDLLTLMGSQPVQKRVRLLRRRSENWHGIGLKHGGQLAVQAQITTEVFGDGAFKLYPWVFSNAAAFPTPMTHRKVYTGYPLRLREVKRKRACQQLAPVETRLLISRGGPRRERPRKPRLLGAPMMPVEDVLCAGTL
jgi:hypothetical protein